MAVTLQTLINQTADYVGVDLTDDDGAVISARLTSALNEAKNTVARRYYPLYHTENVTLDASASFDVTDTTKTFYRLVSVKSGGTEVFTEQRASVIYCATAANAAVSVKYQFIPADLSAGTDAYPFPDVVDYRILCYRAAKTYYEIKGTSTSRIKAALWENKFNDAIKSVLSTDAPETVKDIYNFEPSAW